MKAKVTLEYKRVEGTALSSGCIITERSGGSGVQHFTALEFRPMLVQLHKQLAFLPSDEELDVWLLRTERPGLEPYRLDQRTVKLLRTDIIAAFEALERPESYYSPSLAIQRSKEVQAPVTSLLRVGHDVLADAFGDQLYFRVRDHELECPGCGYWYTYTWSRPSGIENVSSLDLTFVCNKRCRERFTVRLGPGWGQVSTEFLLTQTKCPNFYFPRAWNEGRPWVSREILKKRYDEYLSEKENVQ